MEEVQNGSFPSLPPSSVTIISKSSVYPHQPSTLGRLKLSIFDLRMIAFPYIQRGLLFPRPTLSSSDLINLLRSSLSRALSCYPPLAGRLSTDPDGSFFVACNDAGVDFVHAVAPELFLADLEIHSSSAVPVDSTKDLYLFNGVLGFEGRVLPLAAVQVTELADGVSVGCSVNHAVLDGTSFWGFINSWSELCRGIEKITRQADFRRDFINDLPTLSCIPATGREESGPAARPIQNPALYRVFHFSRKAIQDLKAKANLMAGIEGVVSTFQALCAQLWRSVTRARKVSPGTEMKLCMPANCRHRMNPPLGTHYFGNANIFLETVAKAEDLVGRELGWCAQLLHRNVAALGDEVVRKEVGKWSEGDSSLLLRRKTGNVGTFLVVASSPRFAMYENDMGWGRPVAMLSGPAMKADGGAWAHPGREGGGSIDLEVCLAPETMVALVADEEFMQYVSH